MNNIKRLLLLCIFVALLAITACSSDGTSGSDSQGDRDSVTGDVDEIDSVDSDSSDGDLSSDGDVDVDSDISIDGDADSDTEETTETELDLEADKEYEQDKEAELENEVESELEPDAEIEQELELDGEPEVDLDNSVDGDIDSDTEETTETELDLEADKESEQDTETEIEPEVELELEPEVEAEQELECDCVAEVDLDNPIDGDIDSDTEETTETEIYIEIDKEIEQDTEAELEPELEPEVDLEPEPEVELEPDVEAEQELEFDGEVDTSVCGHIICWPVPPTQKDKCYTWAEPYDEIECPGGIPANCGDNPAIPGCGQAAQYPTNLQTLTCYNSSGVETPCENLPTVSTDEVVTDSLTGLMWQRTFISEINWQTANDYCENLTDYANYSDWRLPKRFELHSIMTHEMYNYDNWTKSGADLTVFPTMDPNSFFWSASPHIQTANSHWYVKGGGSANNAPDTSTGYRYARCVRGEPILLPRVKEALAGTRFVTEETNGQTTIKDKITDLIWKGTRETGKTWQQALAYCEELDYATFTDWRLPNIHELGSMVDTTLNMPATAMPDNELGGEYWSSTSHSNVTDPCDFSYRGRSWVLNVYYGRVAVEKKTTKLTVRCVRGGP